jgi:hypothetical protein
LFIDSSAEISSLSFPFLQCTVTDPSPSSVCYIKVHCSLFRVFFRGSVCSGGCDGLS